MEDDAVVLLAGTGQEAGDVNQRDKRNVEGVAEADKAGTLARGVAVEHAGEELGLVGHHAHGLAVHAGKADDEVLGVVGLDLQELAVVDDGADDAVHVVGLVGRVGDDFVELVVDAVDGVVALYQGSLLEVVLGDVAEELADDADGVLAVLGCDVAYARLLGVHVGTAQVFLADVFAGNGLYNLGAGEEHVADAFGHDGEVGEGGRVDGAAGAGAEDCRNLGNDARGKDVALENLGVAGQGVDALLDAGAARVVEADDGSAHLHGHVHNLADFQGHGLGQRAAEDGEVLGEDVDETAFDCAVTGDDAVAED